MEEGAGNYKEAKERRQFWCQRITNSNKNLLLIYYFIKPLWVVKMKTYLRAFDLLEIVETRRDSTHYKKIDFLQQFLKSQQNMAFCSGL